mmetsp:Transcript_23218/g.65927  ORF Transcript_23218/g.65927 Transcript_23218/m.65927 type:complete len:301 (-) Transcript_23218:642-1544(-)
MMARARRNAVHGLPPVKQDELGVMTPDPGNHNASHGHGCAVKDHVVGGNAGRAEDLCHGADEHGVHGAQGPARQADAHALEPRARRVEQELGAGHAEQQNGEAPGPGHAPLDQSVGKETSEQPPQALAGGVADHQGEESPAMVRLVRQVGREQEGPGVERKHCQPEQPSVQLPDDFQRPQRGGHDPAPAGLALLVALRAGGREAARQGRVEAQAALPRQQQPAGHEDAGHHEHAQRHRHALRRVGVHQRGPHRDADEQQRRPRQQPELAAVPVPVLAHDVGLQRRRARAQDPDEWRGQQR